MSEQTEPVIEPLHARELMARNYERAWGGAACIAHAHIPYPERPAECALCVGDLKLAVAECQRLIEFLQTWRDDALEVLSRQDAALQMIDGWTIRARVDGTADLIRPRIDEVREHLLEGVPSTTAVMIDLYLRSVCEIADGLAPAVSVEGGNSGPR